MSGEEEQGVGRKGAGKEGRVRRTRRRGRREEQFSEEVDLSRQETKTLHLVFVERREFWSFRTVGLGCKLWRPVATRKSLG